MAPPRADGAPFGRVLTAMATPMSRDGEIDFDGVQDLAAHLVDRGNDGLVISGTTGEAPTTTDDEKERLRRAAAEAAGTRGHVVAEVGASAPAHRVGLARQAEKAGAA